MQPRHLIAVILLVVAACSPAAATPTPAPSESPSQTVQARCAQAVTESNEVDAAMLAWENDPNQKLSGLVYVADIADRAAVLDSSLTSDDRLLAYSAVMMGLSSALHMNATGSADTSGVTSGLGDLITLNSVLQDCANGGTMTLPPSLGGSAAP
jgi:hypothetical protein